VCVCVYFISYYYFKYIDHFVRDNVKKGLLPRILQQLLAARSRAKEDLKKATDPIQKVY